MVHVGGVGMTGGVRVCMYVGVCWVHGVVTVVVCVVDRQREEQIPDAE